LSYLCRLPRLWVSKAMLEKRIHIRFWLPVITIIYSFILNSCIGSSPIGKISERDAAILREFITLNNLIGQIPESIAQVDENSEVRSITITNLQIDTLRISPRLKELAFLKAIILRNNKLQYIAPELSELASLTLLNISENIFKAIPQSILLLKNLEALYIYNNKRPMVVPNSIGNLANLTELKLFGDSIASLPPTIGSLTNLKHLHLHNNVLTNLPDEIIKLQNLRLPTNGVGFVKLDGNRLCNLSDSIKSWAQKYDPNWAAQICDEL